LDVVHGAIKPGNIGIKLDENDKITVKLINLDFASFSKNPFNRVNDLHYLPPEILTSENFMLTDSK